MQIDDEDCNIPPIRDRIVDQGIDFKDPIELAHRCEWSALWFFIHCNPLTFSSAIAYLEILATFENITPKAIVSKILMKLLISFSKEGRRKLMGIESI